MMMASTSGFNSVAYTLCIRGQNGYLVSVPKICTGAFSQYVTIMIIAPVTPYNETELRQTGREPEI